MTGRLPDVEARIATVHKLAAVIAAMRGIAASHAREARKHVDSIQLFAGTIGAAIGQALAFQPGGEIAPANGDGDGGHAIIVVAAEQGFAGTYNEQVFDRAAPLLSEPHLLYLAGLRGLPVAAERGLAVEWAAAMITHAAQATALATRLGEAVGTALSAGRARRVSIVHAVPRGAEGVQVVAKRLVPFDYSRFPVATNGVAPILTLPPETLLARLAEEYVFAELSEALMLAFTAENEARMRAMIRAHDKVSEMLGDLVATSRRLRQDDITDEIVELATGSLSAG